MAKIDRLKEEVGWLKVVFGILVAIDVSLVGWLAQNYGKTSWLLILAGVVATAAVTLGVVRVNQVAYDRMAELEDA
jgi:predicted MFS family arabinose efflux permease